MPIINIQLLEGRSAEQKRAFVKAVSEATSATLACSPVSVQILIHDIKKENWSSAGVLWSDKK